MPRPIDDPILAYQADGEINQVNLLQSVALRTSETWL